MPEWRDEVRRQLRVARLDGAAEQEVAEELAQHLEDRFAELRARGASEAQAREQVLRELGEGDALARAVRGAVDVRPEPLPVGRPSVGGWSSGIGSDLRFAARSLGRAPLFTAVVALVMALGIGANTVIFTAVNSLLLRAPGGVRSADELVAVFTSDYSGPRFGSSSYPDYEAIREAPDIFEAVAAVKTQSFGVAGRDWTKRVMGEVVSPNYFDALGVAPAAGRFFAADDGAGVVVISHELWRAHFGDVGSAVGSGITVNGQPLIIIGVAPPEFHGMIRGLRLQLWLPMSASESLTGFDVRERGDRGLMVVGRLRDGSALEEAQARLDVLSSRLHDEFPDEWTDVDGRSRVFTVVAEAEARVPRQARGAILGGIALLMGAVLLVLLVACTNVANLMLSRATARRSEMGVRIALGASRMQIARHLLAESMLLAGIGGVAGLAASAWFAAALRSRRFPVPVSLDAAVDLRVLAFAAAITIGTGVLFGLAPALQASRAPAPMLRDAVRSGRQLRVRHALVAFQVAASLVLLVVGMLFIQSLRELQRVDTGFDVDDVVLVRVEPGVTEPTPEQSRHHNEQLLERATTLPGTIAAALAETVPLSSGWSRRSVDVAEYEPQPGEDMEFMYNGVTAGYFATMGVRIVRGRAFTEEDRAGAPPVAIVTESFAHRFWPEGDAIGKRISFNGRDGPYAEVVGIASDARYRTNLAEPQPYMYYPYAQRPSPFTTLLVRTARDADVTMDALRDVARALAPELPPPTIQPFRDHMADAILPQRVAALLLTVLGGIAVAIAIIGLYGLAAFAVVQRAHEFGVRMALGATAGDVRRLVTGRALRLVAAGMICGLPVAVLAAFLLRQFLLVQPLDAMAFLVVPPVLAASALLASWVPARAATARNPLASLRAE